MASILRVDTLTDASSNNSTAMSTINQGTAKAWINFNGAATGAVGDYDRDSFNMSVTVDNGTGDYTLGFASNMSNANYSGLSGANAESSAATFSCPYTGASFEAHAPTTSAFRFGNFTHNSASNKDVTYTSATIHGDLA